MLTSNKPACNVADRCCMNSSEKDQHVPLHKVLRPDRSYHTTDREEVGNNGQSLGQANGRQFGWGNNRRFGEEQRAVIMENALLRQQVIVLKRQVTRAELTAKDLNLLR